MAIYHFSVKPISRKTHACAHAAAAYRSATRLTSADGQIYDFTRKGGVLYTELRFPSGEQPIERDQLWDLAEAAEKRRDSRVAREFEFALPTELPRAASIMLAQRLAGHIVRRYHVAADLAIHAHGAGDTRNIHAHLMITTRNYSHGVLGEKTNLEKKDSVLRSNNLPVGADQIETLRREWADMLNAELVRYGVQRVDHRTLEEQGIRRQPQRHMGPSVAAMLRRGEYTSISAYNEVIKEKSPHIDRIPDMDDDIKLHLHSAFQWYSERILQTKYRKKFEEKTLRTIEKQFFGEKKPAFTDKNTTTMENNNVNPHL